MFLSRLSVDDTDTPDQWLVSKPLVWCDSVYGRLEVPAGTITDLASIPRRLRDVRAFDPNGKSRRPAVAHDYLYATALFNKSRADSFLRDALLAEGVGRCTAHAFYYAVHWFGGPAWRACRASDFVRLDSPK